MSQGAPEAPRSPAQPDALELLREALGRPSPEMVVAGANAATGAAGIAIECWTAMAAVRLRDVLSGAKEV